MSDEVQVQPSRAVIANHDNCTGLVLWHTADSYLDHEIDQLGSRRLDDLGLDDAPHGISIWEGTYVWQPGGYECPEDGMSMPDGRFRSPTDDEWVAIRDGRNPWA